VRDKAEDKFDLGQAIHSFLLEGVDLVHVIHENDWRKKAAQEARDEARSYGKIPMLAKNWHDAKLMLGAVRAQLDEMPITPRPFTDGEAEKTLVWNERGVACRARLDWIHNGGLVIDDLKTSAVDFSRWTQKTLWDNGYAIQACMYQRAVQACYGTTFTDFRFVLAETTAPYAVSVIDLAPTTIAFANEQLDWAIETWRRCLSTGEWPGYPPRVSTIEAPSWVETRWYERQAIAEAAAA
jgi:hypothetical protein